MASLNDRITELENIIVKLESKISDLSENVESKSIQPYSKVGGGRDRSQLRPIQPGIGLGQMFGGNIIWNNSELHIPPIMRKPSTPTRGYNKHSHSKYSGGALDITTLELVEYDLPILSNGEWDSDAFSKHCQQFWVFEPPIKKVNGVEKIGHLDIRFYPDEIHPLTKQKGVWKAGSAEIDIKNTYLVIRDDDPESPTFGQIKKDIKGNPMKSPLTLWEENANNETKNKANVVWDKEAKCFRFYAVFKPYQL